MARKDNSYPLQEFNSPDEIQDLDRANELATLVSNRMEAYGWSIQALADAVGTNRTSITRMLKGERKINGETLVNILQVLGLRLVFDDDLAQKQQQLREKRVKK